MSPKGSEFFFNLMISNIILIIRNIWYQYFQALKLSQESSDELFEDIACGVGVPRASIHILAASKGLVHGNVTLYLHKGKRDIPEGTSTSRILSDWSSADKAISDIQVIDCSSVCRLKISYSMTEFFYR